MLAALFALLPGIIAGAMLELNTSRYVVAFPDLMHLYSNTARLVLAISVALVLLAGLWMGYGTARWYDACCAGFLLGGLFMLFLVITWIFCRPSELFTDSPRLILGKTFQYVFLVGGFAAFVTLGAHCLFTLLFGRVVYQDGSLCRVCGYPAGQSDSERCPECGSLVPIVTVWPTIDLRIAQWLQERWRIIVSLAAGVGILGLAMLAWRSVPYAQFVHRFGEGDYSKQRFMEARTHAVSVFRAIPEHSDLVMVLEYGRSGPWQPLHLRLSIARKDKARTWSKANPLVFAEAGLVHIYADLTRSQTEYAFEHGIPDGVVNMIVDKAEETGWIKGPIWARDELGVENFEVEVERFFPEEINDGDE